GGQPGIRAAREEQGAVGVLRGDELVGAAVGEVGGGGLLANGGVGAAGGEEFEALVFGGRGAPCVFGDKAEVVGDALEAGEVGLDGVGGRQRFADFAVGNGSAFAVGRGGAVFE